MARGKPGAGPTTPRVRKTIEVRIADIEKSIEDHKRVIAELSDQRKALLEEQKLEKVNALLKVMEENGMNVDQLMELAKSGAGK